MALLNYEELISLVAALNKVVDGKSDRRVLFTGIDRSFFSVLAVESAPFSQVLSDLTRMNEAERLANGEVPLELYLRNALLLTGGQVKEEEILRTALQDVQQRASGAPVMDAGEFAETKEVIIVTDDMVPFTFMKNGAAAADSVVKLKIKSYKDGQVRKNSNGNDLLFLGTGWLLSDDLLITNHHVIAARKEGEPAANAADFKLQAEGTALIFDFNDDDDVEAPLHGASLVIADAVLDYAIIRISSTGRQPLTWSSEKVNDRGLAVPLNIIQHPGGKSKRYAIRNNLLSSATDAELRYFTDTEGGSSGSPVFNDQWQVVALHRAAVYVKNVKFQGKTTAYLNIGTPITAIKNDILSRNPDLAAELLLV